MNHKVLSTVKELLIAAVCALLFAAFFGIVLPRASSKDIEVAYAAEALPKLRLRKRQNHPSLQSLFHSI